MITNHGDNRWTATTEYEANEIFLDECFDENGRLKRGAYMQKLSSVLWEIGHRHKMRGDS